MGGRESRTQRSRLRRPNRMRSSSTRPRHPQRQTNPPSHRHSYVPPSLRPCVPSPHQTNPRFQHHLLRRTCWTRVHPKKTKRTQALVKRPACNSLRAKHLPRMARTVGWHVRFAGGEASMLSGPGNPEMTKRTQALRASSVLSVQYSTASRQPTVPLRPFVPPSLRPFVPLFSPPPPAPCQPRAIL